MTWSFDIEAAPRGRHVTVKRVIKGKEHEITDFVPDVLWLATEAGEVIQGYWIQANKHVQGRWAGLATNQQPIAWQRFVKPDHPGARPSAQHVDLPIIEDVGGM